MGEAAEWQACQGFLFKLKENHKEWKKLYVVLDGGSIVYYDSPLGEREREASSNPKRADTARSTPYRSHPSHLTAATHTVDRIQVLGPTASSRTV